MLTRRILCVAAFLFCLLPLCASAQFAHTQQKQIVDANGKPFLIRGTNLGNWFMPEGYMWNFDGGPQSAGEIEALVRELLGPDKATDFWHQYREDYITREDIHLLHEAGLNTVRIPIHYKFFETDNSEGFMLLNRVIQWCHEEGLYVIIDMHAAPGGQTGANIDDSDGYPWLYDSPREQAHLAAVWQRIARHYKDNPTVLGYDLLNEPIPHYPSLAPLNAKLEPVYRMLTKAIRPIDSHHILFLGGAQWDSNFSVFHQPFDNNTAYTFHKYWTKTDVSVIQQYLDFRDRYNVPIWMGESGENTDEWITQFVALLNKNDIGWTFWPYKKMSNTSAIVTITPPEGWDKIVAFAKLPSGTGHVEERLKARPDQDTINRAFAGLLENIKLKNCHVNPGYLKALGMKSVSVN
ncbi:cellulase family glycosylhydrolase [Edaphobacter paludis]|uniref:Cellulase family glycosylhydrolase n=1 Tax=Edaphobacter paludis TaxID=3035702 RepID=A0AAU7DAW3_9BACT